MINNFYPQLDASEYPRDIETGFPETDNIIEIKRENNESSTQNLFLNSEVHETVLKILSSSAELAGVTFPKTLIEAHESIKVIKLGKKIAENESSLSIVGYLDGSEENSKDVPKNFHELVNFAAIATKHLPSGINFLYSSETLTKICETASPYIKSAAGPFKLLADIHALQAAFEMPENTKEEKAAKKLQLLACKSRLAYSVANTGLLLAPELAATSIVSVPMAIAGLGIALVNGYLIYQNHQNATHEELHGEELV